MAEENDPLVQAMIDAGLYQQRLRPIQQRYAFGQQLLDTPSAQGAQVGNTFVAASPLSHLSSAIRRIYGAKLTNDSMQAEQDLTNRVAEGRQKFGQGLQIAQSGGESVGAPPMLARPPDPQRAQQLETMAMASGDQPMQQTAQYLRQSTQFAQQHGPQAALGGLTPETATAKAHLLGAQQNWVPFSNPDTGEAYVVNHRTGEVRKMGGMPGQGPSGPTAQPVGKLGQKWLDQLKTDLDPNQSRAGTLKGNQERLNAAQRLLTLAVDPLTGGPANLTPQQMSEVSNSLATLIGGGGSSEGSRHELTPYTRGRSMAQLLQWWSNKPQGADQQAFVKQMIDTAKREQGVAEGAIRQAQAQRLPAHMNVFQRYPDQAKGILEGYGFDPSEVDLKTGKYTPKPKAAAPPPQTGAAAHPQANTALEWAKAHPDDPRSLKIFQALGVSQ